MRYREIAEDRAHDIELQLSKYFTIMGKHSIGKDGFVSTPNSCTLSRRFMGNHLPVKFKSTGSFICEGNGTLTSLIGSPLTVIGHFNCNTNAITTLEGAPRHVANNFHCRCWHLKSLKGAPDYVGGVFHCSGATLDSLEGLPKHTGAIDMSYSEQLPLLRLLNVRGWIRSGNDHVDLILNKYNGKQNNRSNLIACQKALIDAGFEGNASW